MRKIIPCGVLTIIAGLALLVAFPSEGRGQVAQNRQPQRAEGVDLTPRRADAESRKTNELSVISVVGALAVVIGVFILGMWLFRRVAPAGFGVLPAEAFESLGRARLNSRQQVHLLRCGDKLLLVAVGMAGATTLTEITDPAEVKRLSESCHRPRSAAPRQTVRRGGSDG